VNLPYPSEGLSYYPSRGGSQPYYLTADVCIYGATVAGIAAAIQARRMGRSVLLLAFSGHIGGMTTSGLGATDYGARQSIGGIAREFYRRIGARYGMQEVFTFEPQIAEAVLREWCREEGIPILYQQRLVAVEKRGSSIAYIATEGGNYFIARYFIDASYEGDLLAAAGVTCTVGRESNDRYGETLNGIYPDSGNHNFLTPIDPYNIPGNPNSGLLPMIDSEPWGKTGEADDRVQAYCFRLCVSSAAGRIPFPRPSEYDAVRYELLLRYILARGGATDMFNLVVNVSNGRAKNADMNNYGAVSLDYVGGNHAWAQASYEQRERIFQEHVNYQKGLLYFLANEPRVPDTIRQFTQRLGLTPDAFASTGGWPHQLYIREARRMISDTVLTERHVFSRESVSDSIALASYTADSHHTRRIVLITPDGPQVRNEGCFEVFIPRPWGISYRAIVPRASECINLASAACISATHVTWSSLRMEPVFFSLGQAAATAACLSMAPIGADVNADAPLQRLSVSALQDRLRSDGQVIA
jgi:hypothetical protein